MLSQHFQGLVQFEMGQAGGESCHGDVGLAIVKLVVGDVGVDDLQCFVHAYADGVDVP